jgi:hypothetical protein
MHGATEILYDQYEEIDQMIKHLKDDDVDALLLDTPIANYHSS